MNGGVRYDVVLIERRVEDLQVLQKYGRKDEVPFRTVESVSDASASAYEAFVQPILAPAVTPAAARVSRTLNPQRAQRWAVSDLNPFLRPLRADGRSGQGQSSAARQRGNLCFDGALGSRHDLRFCGISIAICAMLAWNRRSSTLMALRASCASRGGARGGGRRGKERPSRQGGALAYR